MLKKNLELKDSKHEKTGKNTYNLIENSL